MEVVGRAEVEKEGAVKEPRWHLRESVASCHQVVQTLEEGRQTLEEEQMEEE